MKPCPSKFLRLLHFLKHGFIKYGANKLRIQCSTMHSVVLWLVSMSAFPPILTVLGSRSYKRPVGHRTLPSCMSQ